MIFLVYSQFHCAIFVLRNMKLIISIFAFSGGSADGPFLRKKTIFLQCSGAHISWHELFLSGNQGNHQNLIPSMLTYKF